MRGVRWLDAGIIQSILAGIRFRPSFAVNVADPHQDLLPLSSGLLNFVAVDEVDSWRIAIFRLSRRSIVTSGLSFAVTDDPTRHEVAVPIQPLAAERLPLSGLRRRYAVRSSRGIRPAQSRLADLRSPAARARSGGRPGGSDAPLLPQRR